MVSGKKAGTIRVGTRGSQLASLQTEIVINKLLREHPSMRFEMVPITTSGDKDPTRPIAALGGTGVFVKELEDALLADEVDFVVHSLKDLTTELPTGLRLAAVLSREDARDVLVSKDNLRLEQLPAGSKLATSSNRRTAQIRAIRSDLEIVDIRGNIPTRVRKLDEGQCDAMVLAAAGLIRLKLTDRISQYLELDSCIPAAGQGALAAECRQNDKAITALLETIDDDQTRVEITAERTLLKRLSGGCSVPIGAFAKASGNELKLIGCVAAIDGSEVIRHEVVGSMEQPEELGEQLAIKLLKMGAESILYGLKMLAPNAISPP
jgi:hydroxymethylbilane synthase